MLSLTLPSREWRGDVRSHRGLLEGKCANNQIAKNTEDAEQTAEAYVCQKYIQDPLVVGGTASFLFCCYSLLVNEARKKQMQTRISQTHF